MPITSDVRWSTFAVMWAIANIVHLANHYIARIDNPAGWANLVAAVLVLNRPRSVRRMALLAATQLLEVAWVSPLAPDHAVLAAAVNIAILLCLARVRTTPSDERDLRPAVFFDCVAAPARLLLLIGYGAAAIAKYNANFFDPVHSCAVHLADAATFGLAGGHPALAPVHIAFSVVLESLIPVLLLVPRTRRMGVRVGIVFHFLVSLSPTMHVGDFSTTLWALFLLFLSRDDLVDVVARMRLMLARSPVARAVRSLDHRAASIALIVVTGASGWLPFATDFGVRAALSLAVFVYGVVVVSSVLRAGHLSPDAVRVRYRPTTAQTVLLVSFAVWSLNPYLGFRTTASFTMFSGLVTEGPGTNHFFMPSLHLVDHQNDLVVLQGSDDEGLRDLAELGQALPYLEVQRAVAAGARVEGRRDGASLPVTADGRTDVPDPPPWLAKIWHFRAVAADGEPQCTN